jgi:hypothetical protein
MSTQQSPKELNENPFHTGDRIRKARELAGFGTSRKTEFADLLGVDRGSLAKYEDGGKVKRSVLISIAWNTPVNLDWLETGHGPVLKGGEGPEGGQSEISQKITKR